ncbi:hypothetical protein [Mycolicibacterium rhodesiae]|uniref:ARB-07466-like C-terminal domain-containing protein n=1 Tax=Mycolicibacterium rhodesiae TaxID=36814 RepID=A0A1X0J5L9_MYCRH|nr:hypothetical protein [Mycolicibacterium rhodesiae]MCV7348273.1 hypothetical protein [Mycolicibacterium rhodesiae]ORB57388.1 hypothetical protein BST42_03155 [Mycolicibacterium rhodesiae]
MSIRIDVIAEINEKRLKDQSEKLRRDVDRDLTAEFNQIGVNAGNSMAQGLAQSSGSVQKELRRSVEASQAAALKELGLETARRKVDAASRAAMRTEQLLNDARRGHVRDLDTETKLEAKHAAQLAQVSSLSEKAARAEIAHTKALNARADAERRLHRGRRDAASRAGVGSNLAAGGMSLVWAGAGPLLLAAAGAAASLTGAIALMPGVIGAAGTAFGAIALGVHGFGDAMKETDPAKFAAALQTLSPNAREAAQSIKSIMPVLHDLQKSTQDSLFKGVGGELTALTETFRAPLQGLTTSVAGSFNQAFRAIGAELMQPESAAALGHVFDNISTAFTQIAPAARSFTDALVRITSVGSDFFPGMAKALSDAAAKFASFIETAQRTGQLKQWISEALDTLKVLGGVVVSVGKAFGSLAPAAREILPPIADMLEKIAGVLRDHPSLIYAVVGAFTAWKTTEGVASLTTALRTVSTLLGVTIPASAAAGAAATSAAWAPVLASLAKWAPALGVGAMPDQQNAADMGLILPGIPQLGGGPGAQRQRRGVDDPAAPPAAAPTGPGFLGGSVGVPHPTGPSWSLPGNIFGSSNTSNGGGSSSSGYSGHVEDTHGALVPNAELLKQALQQLFPGVQIGGYRAPDGYNEHSSGEALDIMVGGNTALGNVVNQWLLRNADAFGLQYDLWQQAEWDPNGTVKPMADRGSPTQNHRDHVHARVRPGAPESGNYMPVGSQEWNFNGTTPVRVESFGSQASQTMQQSIGAGLDSDFGIGKGLPGIFESLTKMLANLAMAPILGALSGVTGAFGSAGPGSGLLGALAPRQNAFAQQMPDALGRISSQSGGSSSGGLASLFSGTSTPQAGSSAYGDMNSPQSSSPGLGTLGSAASGASYSPGAGWNLPNATGSRNTAPRGIPLGQGMPQSSGISIGKGGVLGLIGSAATSAAGLAAGMGSMGGGGAAASAAAQIGIDELNRAIGFGAQAVGIGVQGLMETFLPVESQLADPTRGWFGRILGGVAGIRPVAENLAGAMGKGDRANTAGNGDQPPLTDEQVAKQRDRIGSSATNNTNVGGVTVNAELHGQPDANAQALQNLTTQSWAGQKR